MRRTDMQVKKITKKLRVSHYDAVRCQLINELSFVRKEYLIPSDMEFLTLLTLWRCRPITACALTTLKTPP